MGAGFLSGSRDVWNQAVGVQPCEYKDHRTVHFKTANFMLHELHLNF